MKIAIMGAGLSGLSCAFTLEKYGLNPVIFEKRSEVDDRFVNCEVFLDALSSPIKDSLKYFSNEFNIFLQPVSHIGKLVILSENERATIEGNLGFNNIRGRREESISKQLQKQIKSKIIFNSNYSYENLLKEYSHIVVATGDGSYSEKMRNYKTDLTVSLKGAIIKGRFDKYTTYTWGNNKFAPKGYSYLIPISDTEANIVIAYPDYPENNKKNIDILWNNFYSEVKNYFKQNFDISDEFQISKYVIGKCKTPRIGNTLFVGNCFGAVMPFLGFGQTSAILTGVYAAYDLCGKGDYNDLVKPLEKSYDNSLKLRRAMETLDNKKYDLLVKSMDGYIGNKILSGKKHDFLALLSKIATPFVHKNKD